MIAADIAKLLCAWPPGGSPCAKLRQSIVILAGLIVAKANECVRRAAVMWISQKMPESDGCFGETILVIKQAAEIPPSIRPRGTQARGFSIEPDRIGCAIFTAGGFGLMGNKIETLGLGS